MSLFPIGIYQVVGNSMNPIYKHGERVVVQQWFLFPTVLDIVILKDPRNERLILKRIVKTSCHPEQNKGFSQENSLAKLQNENKLEYFVEGDNKNESTDSRIFGWVKRKQIIGRVIFPKRV